MKSNEVNKQLVLNAIPSIGSITRKQLQDHTGLSDRLNRKAVEELRKDGYSILCDTDGSGYRMCKDEKDKQQLLNEYKSRIKSEIQTLIALSDVVEATDFILDAINQTDYTG